MIMKQPILIFCQSVVKKRGNGIMDEEKREKSEVTSENENIEVNSTPSKSLSKRIVVAVSAVAVLVIGGIGYGICKSSTVELKKATVVSEYGDTVSTNPNKYFTGSRKALSKVKIDASVVNPMEAGAYKMTAKKGKKHYEIKVIVKDTVNPSVEIKKNLYAMVNEEIKASSMVMEISDLSGIKNMSFKNAQIESKGNKVDSPDAVLKYEKTGKQKNSLIVTDNNGNETVKDFELTVVTKDESKKLVAKGETVLSSDSKTTVIADNKASDSKKGAASKDESKSSITSEKNTSRSVTKDDNETTLPAAPETSSTTESGSSSSGGESSTPISPPAHEHNWVAQTTVVHHDATGHNEPIYTTVTDYEKQSVYICQDCGAINPSDDHCFNHALNGGTGSTRVDYIQVAVGSHQEQTGTTWVQDTAAWDETVTTGYVCSGCGATK